MTRLMYSGYLANRKIDTREIKCFLYFDLLYSFSLRCSYSRRKYLRGR